MQKEDLKRAPKLFAENAKIGYTPEYFVLGVSSGEKAHIFSMTPAHAKRLKQYLEHELSEFEKQYGEITAEWTPNVVSPVQRHNPPTKGS
ncbi:MAG TPA: DUF3467 domain-containing protein [Candidatus Paceibacterota bacterium]|nr:DUF3467 domain-containing protein [Candidatus Paceibacterota bacterium]